MKKFAIGGPTAPLPTNQMHHAMSHSVGEDTDIRNVGVNEAPNMPVKTFVMPPGGEDLPLGKMPGGALPTGGVSFQPGTPGALGQAPQAPQGQPQAPQGQPQAPQGQPRGLQAPQGLSGAGQPPSNILSMTHQGQTMAAMAPGQGLKPQGLADGGQPKASKAYDAANPTPHGLTQAFDEALKQHLGMSPQDRALNTVRMAHRVGNVLGFSEHNGRPKDILNQSEEAHGVKLHDGRGVEIAGVALAPTMSGPTESHTAKTHAMLSDPHSFAVKLHDEIEAAKQQAGSNGNHLGVRLNVMSDLHPRLHKSIIHAHPDVTFYDYTQNNTNPIAANHHYTHISNGVDHVHTNWGDMQRRLRNGDNVAMTFGHDKDLPTHVHDIATNLLHKVIDGDAHDFRPADEPGVIVGHRNKRATGTPENAHIESHGFFVHYNPDLHGQTARIRRQIQRKG